MTEINDPSIHCEIAGNGQPIVMIHAGVADSRQWNNEFHSFASRYQVIRYDMRGYGRSEPVDGDFSHLGDLTGLLERIDVDQPLILVGCSMGGGLALDFALERPSKVKALIMVGSAPSGLEIDIEEPAKFKLVEKAYNAGDLDLVAEIETQIWFDGGRAPGTVNQEMRALAYEMNRIALSHESKHLGKQQADTEVPAIERLNELRIPVLALVGAEDIPYMHAAVDYMVEHITNIRTEVIENAAHLSNMDQPARFKDIVLDFLESLPDP